MISVIIPNYNGRALLDACLGSIFSQGERELEVLLVDNGSSDDSVRFVRENYPQVKVIRLERNRGFAAAVNRGIAESRGELIAVVNNDARLMPGWFAAVARALAADAQAWYCASKIYDSSGRLESAGDLPLRAGIGYRIGQGAGDGYSEPRAVLGASAAAAAYRRALFEHVGRFDDDFFAYYEDLDLSLRAALCGLRGTYAPDAVVYHLGSATSGGEFSDLGVYLKTRNVPLLLIKNIPLLCLLRWSPMILCYQISWLWRVAARRKIRPYLKGWAGALRLLPRMLARRRALMRRKRLCSSEFARLIAEAEREAARDFARLRDSNRSLFLEIYFRLFLSKGFKEINNRRSA